MTFKHFWINLFAGVAFLLFAVWLFTRPSFIQAFNLSDKGQIGDVIGGISTPFISLAGAILVFLSFKEQVTANRLQRDSLENEIKQNKIERTLSGFTAEFNSLKTDTSNLKFTHYDNGGRLEQHTYWKEHDGVLYAFHGIDAVEKYLRILPLAENEGIKCGVLYDLQFIIGNFISLFHSVHENNIISKEEKKDMLDKLLLFHYTKFRFVLAKIKHLNEKNERFKNQYSFFNATIAGADKILEIHSKEYKKKESA